jgi:hypothetical protein
MAILKKYIWKLGGSRILIGAFDSKFGQTGFLDAFVLC